MTRYQKHQLTALTAHYNAVEAGLDPGVMVMPPAKPKRKRSYEESDNQKSFFKWWNATHQDFLVPACLIYAIPNGSVLGTGKEDWQVLQRVIRGKRLISEGLTPGVFDIFCGVPRPDSTGRMQHGLYVEMKKKDGIMSLHQVAFKASAEAFGYKCVVAYTDQQAIQFVTAYLNEKAQPRSP